MKVLSTKTLSLSQKELLLNTGISFVEYDAIKIEFSPVKIPSKISNAIFTSQNAVRSLEQSKVTIENCFCVGPKTKLLLEENGRNVVKMSDNSNDLGVFIAKNHSNDTFYYFCGNERRDELPNILKSQKIHFLEQKTYKTTPNWQKFHQKWDGILFFSPSGVSSFVKANLDSNQRLFNYPAFCIGSTTAGVAKDYFSNTVTANATIIESVIAKAAKTLKKYD